MSELKVLQKI